jgi:hypothetical protein
MLKFKIFAVTVVLTGSALLPAVAEAKAAWI